MQNTLVLVAALLLTSATAHSQVEPKTTLGGYGELHYNEPDGSRRGMLDFHRFVLYVAHNFTEKISFRSEIEIEHTLIEAGEPEGGEVSIEQAFIDYHISDRFGVRAGILLPPVGLINLYHEPPTFNGVERPSVERIIIPTTWRESGAGIYGNLADGLAYQLYVVAGLKAEGFSASSGLRGGRQSAFESNPANPSVTGRIDYSPLTSLFLGGSFFVGSSAADEHEVGNAMVSLWSGDVRYTFENFAFRAVGAFGTIGDAEKINATFGGSVADRIYGYYAEGAYNMLPFLCGDTEEELNVFARYERYNTQASTTGFLPLNQHNRTDVVIGLTYKPTFNVAFKFDYTFFNNSINTGAFRNTKQLNLGVGYYFF
jgi:hypothetical protein